jgi:hypothetical protein
VDASARVEVDTKVREPRHHVEEDDHPADQCIEVTGLVRALLRPRVCQLSRRHEGGKTS